MPFKQRKRAIVQFHDYAFERAEHARDFDQMQSDRLVFSEHLPRSDAEKERVTNLAGGRR